MGESKELVERLRFVGDILDTHAEKLPVPSHIRHHATKTRKAADLIEHQSKIIRELADALEMYRGNFEEAGDLFEDGQNEEAWEWIGAANLKAKKALRALTAPKADTSTE